MLGNVNFIRRHLELFTQFGQIFTDLFFVDRNNDNILVLFGVLQHAAVHGHFPGIIVFQVTHLAGVRADKSLGLGRNGRNIDRLLTAAGRQNQCHKAHDENSCKVFSLHVSLLGLNFYVENSGVNSIDLQTLYLPTIGANVISYLWTNKDNYI